MARKKKHKNFSPSLTLFVCIFLCCCCLSLCWLNISRPLGRSARRWLAAASAVSIPESVYIYGMVSYTIYVNERVKCRFHACAALSALFVYVRQSTISDTLAVSIPREWERERIRIGMRIKPKRGRVWESERTKLIFQLPPQSMQ